MVLAGTLGLVLGALKVGQYLLIGPAPVSEATPVVVVFPLAANIDHAIDGTGAAYDLAPRPGHPAVMHIGFRLGFITPVDLGVFHQEGEPQRDMDDGQGVAVSGLQQQDPAARFP